MLQRENKIAVEFGLTVAEALELQALGLDTPRALKEADPEDIPSAIRAKLTRWHPEQG